MGPKMIELKTELPDDANVHWVHNGMCAWLEDGKGNKYRPPKWVYRLTGEAKIQGRNQVRQEIESILTPEPDELPRD